MSAPARALAALCAAGLAASCGLLYAGTLHYDFAYDDFMNIVGSPFIRWREISLENLWAATRGPTNARPIAMYSFGLNHLAGGYDPFGYRIVNVAIHAANGVLVFALAWRVLARLPALPALSAAGAPGPRAALGLALLSGLIFVAHPLQTNSVTYVVQRMNSLATLFYLGGLLLYAHGRARGAALSRARIAAVALCTLLACGSKQIGVTLPYAIWLYEWTFHRGFDRAFARRSAPWLAAWTWLLAAAALAILWGPELGYARREFSMLERLMTQPRVVLHYLALIAFPHPDQLSLFHDVRLSRSPLDPWTTLPALAALLALAGGAAAVARRRPLLAFAVAWFFLHLAVESSFLPLEMMYEHRTYLPLVGLAIWAPAALRGALRGRTAATLAVGAVLVLALAAGTRARNQVWRSNEALWRDVIAKSPRHPIGYSNLGSTLQQQGRYEESLEGFRRALAIDPDFDDAHRGLGASLMGLDRFDESLAHYREAVRLDPRDYQAHGGHGAVLATLGRFEEAEAAHRRSLEIFPDERILTNYGRVLHALGRDAEAIHALEAAIRQAPDMWDPHFHLGELHDARGRPEAAARAYAEAVRRGADPEARIALAAALWESGRAAEAVRTLEPVYAARPDDLQVANNLAWMLSTAADPTLRDPARALRVLEPSARDTRDPGLLDTLAAAYAAAGRFEAARTWAGRAAEQARERGDDGLEREIRARIEAYEASQPHLDPASKPRGRPAPSLR